MPPGVESLDPSSDQTFSAHPQPLISRNYKGDVAMSEIEHFMPLLMQREEEGALAPLMSHGRVHFLWIKYSNLYCIRGHGRIPGGPEWWAAQAQRWWAGTRGAQYSSGSGWRVRVQGLCSIGTLQNGTFSLTSLPAVVATTLKNANASLVYSFLYKTVEVGPGLPLAGWSVCLPVLPTFFGIHLS